VTGQVTRHFLANFGQNADFGGGAVVLELPPCTFVPDYTPPPFFVDWLTLRQTHTQELPVINAGVIMKTDLGGEIVWRTTAPSKVEGSHDTSVQIRCDGHTVQFSGNVSRFGRTDNLFGYDLAGCIRRVNNILARLGLPPYTMGLKYEKVVKTIAGNVPKTAWTGCQISRMDLTANFETGSRSNARAYMEWLSTQQGSARLKVGTFAHGETVDWGRGSRRLYAKVYDKGAEIRKHGGPEDLADYCDEVGLVRFELTLKATQLHAMGCNYLGGLDMTNVENLFDEKRKVLTRAEHTHDDFEQLPNALRRTARDWLAGDDVLRHMSDRTMRRHRASLLPYGIDISVKRNVIDFKPRVRVIEVRAASVPAWYDLCERLAA